MSLGKWRVARDGASTDLIATTGIRIQRGDGVASSILVVYDLMRAALMGVHLLHSDCAAFTFGNSA